MALTEAQKRAVAKYNAANYERIELRVPRGKKAELQEYAQAHGESLNAFINRAIDEAMGRE